MIKHSNGVTTPVSGSTSKNKDIFFLTGISGSLGSWLAAHLVRQGHQIVALIRDKKGQSGGRRLRQIFTQLGFEDCLDAITVVDGEITEPNLGVAPNTRALKNLTKIIHCAACTNFKDSFSQATYNTNVIGTRHALAFARRHGLPMIYVSTAYIAGKRSGRVFESELDKGQSFNNAYENTKCQAEQEVHAWSEETGLPTQVLRPSIVLGDTQAGRTVRFNSLYDLLRVLDLIVPHKQDDLLHIPAQSQTTKNIIPVDYFTEVACHLIERAIPGTYHITHPHPLRIEQLAEIMCRLFGKSRFEWIDSASEPAENANEVERTLHEIIASYAPYAEAEPVFDTSETDRVLADVDISIPKLDTGYFEKILQYARTTHWGKTQPVLSS
jgi:thioester reductase-like protein